MIRHKRQEERLCDPFEMAVDLLQWDIVNLLTEYGYNLSQHEYLRDSVFLDTIPAALKNDPSMFALLQETARKPPSLQKLVVLRVRDILTIDISNKVQSLSLPNSLKSDISMVEISWQFSVNPTIYYPHVHVLNNKRSFFFIAFISNYYNNTPQTHYNVLHVLEYRKFFQYTISVITISFADGVYFVSLFFKPSFIII